MSDGSAARPAVEASLDVVVDGTLMGWARDLERPGDAALLQLRLGERRIALFRADRFRPDLRDAGFGTGHHGFASLHRSEGLGLGILEAMRLGVPVLCTAYGGNMDVCDPETAWLVEADEVPVGPGDYAYAAPGHLWAEPRHAAAVDALRSLRGQPALRDSRAVAARARVEERCSVAAAAKRYAARLGEIMPGGLRRTDRPSPALGPETSRSRRFAWSRGG